jgi:hypothetical protein
MKRLSELFMRPSTRAFMQEARRTPGFSWIDRLHGYIYARWTYLYISMGIGEHPIVRTLGPVREWIKRRFLSFVTTETPRQVSATESTATFADGYHGKVLPLETATQLVTINQEISLPNLEQVIPYVRARDLILENPDHIVVLDCPCRMAREHPCLPLDVCLIIGEPFASLVIEHHPRHARWITSGEAVEILRRRRGGATCTMLSSKMQCWAASTRSATAAPAAAGRCRPSGMARPCWPPRDMSVRSRRKPASAADAARNCVPSMRLR